MNPHQPKDGEKGVPKRHGSPHGLTVLLSMRLNIPSHNGSLHSLFALTLLSTLTHTERSLNSHAEPGRRRLTPHETSERASRPSRCWTRRRSTRWSCRQSRASALARPRPRWLVHVNALSASAIVAFAGAACNSRTRARRATARCVVLIWVIRASYMPHMLAFGNRILCYF